MPNWCSSTITLRCRNEKYSKAVCNKIASWCKNPEEWLGNILIEADACSLENINDGQVRCRGSLIQIKADGRDVILDTETAWAPMLQMWKRICEKHFPEVENILYKAEEPGCDLFFTNDESVVGNIIVDIPEQDVYIVTDSEESAFSELVKEVNRKWPELLKTKKCFNAADIIETLQQDYNEEVYVHVYEYVDIDELS